MYVYVCMYVYVYVFGAELKHEGGGYATVTATSVPPHLRTFHTFSPQHTTHITPHTTQGMDESNERLTIERIVSSCCGDATKVK